ncbi:MAG: L,D-transpeptidase family protein [Acidiferrobacterales bacterium]
MIIEVDVLSQTFTLRDALGHVQMQTHIATARNGVGEEFGSERTPRGWHVIRAKIGAGLAPGAVLVSRRATGEIYTPGLRRSFPDRDWILTRILWLSGLEPGRNRLGSVDTMRRYIYIHGCPDEDPMGVPSSRGCVKMRNHEIVELFDRVPAGTRVHIIAPP